MLLNVSQLLSSRAAWELPLQGACLPDRLPSRANRMLDNAPFLSHPHQNLTIEGYSRAAVQTYWRIPELRIGFDLGAQPWDFMGTAVWAISHSTWTI